MTPFAALAAAATVALVGQLLRLAHLSLNRRVFLEYIERLVASGNLDRALKLTDAHRGPVARLTRTALLALHAGRAASVAPELAEQAPAWRARVRWLGWPVRLLGIAAVIAGAVLLARTPYSRNDPTFAVAACGTGLVVVLVLLTLRGERRLLADIDKTVKTLGRLAHAA
jgi:hypothetical protein